MCSINKLKVILFNYKQILYNIIYMLLIYLFISYIYYFIYKKKIILINIDMKILIIYYDLSLCL